MDAAMSSEMEQSACADLQTDAMTWQQRVFLVVRALELLRLAVPGDADLGNVDELGAATCA